MSTTSEEATGNRRAGESLRDYFRCPEGLVTFTVEPHQSPDAGYFWLGQDIICFGRCSSGVPARSVTDPLHNAWEHVAPGQRPPHLPFDPEEIIDNLLRERYSVDSTGGKEAEKGFVRNLYYLVRPLLPVYVRKHVQKLYFRGWENVPFPAWPVDRTVDTLCEKLLILSMKSQNLKRVPFIWFWPEASPSCTILTHDVETSTGAEFCSQLMDLTDSFGIKSSFQIVPEKRYPVSDQFLDSIRNRGFEINVHDLNHDGHLMRSRDEFSYRANRIHQHAQRFGAKGFRSAILYRNLDWLETLDFSYDMSVPNVAHLDPQHGGCCTIFPFFAGKLLELPVTATQDYSLFHILNDYSTRLWREQIAIILKHHGLISFIIHPDYIIGDKARRVCSELLQELSRLRAQGQTWIALPGEVANWWRLRSKMNLVKTGEAWKIEGEGFERATIAYATEIDNKLCYTFDPNVRDPSISRLAETKFDLS